MRGYSTTIIYPPGPGDAAGHVSGRALAESVPGGLTAQPAQPAEPAQCAGHVQGAGPSWGET